MPSTCLFTIKASIIRKVPQESHEKQNKKNQKVIKDFAVNLPRKRNKSNRTPSDIYVNTFYI